jgi:hypothetical protein
MHTILKKPLTEDDFEMSLPEGWLETLNKMVDDKDFNWLINCLPQGFIQRRIWCLSYKTLQNIYSQRNAHKLLEWRDFCDALVEQLQHPEFIGPITEGDK